AESRLDRDASRGWRRDRSGVVRRRWLVTRREYVGWEVLNAICDSGENVDQRILDAVNRDAGKTGIRINRAEIVEALAELVQRGLATPAHLSCWPGQSVELSSMPPMDEIETCFKTYFFITEEGMKVHLSNDSWLPLDDSGRLRPEWRLDDK